MMIATWRNTRWVNRYRGPSTKSSSSGATKGTRIPRRGSYGRDVAKRSAPIPGKIPRLLHRPRLAPVLAAAVDRQRLAGDVVSGRRRKIGAGLRNVPGRADAHHRIGARIGGARLRRIDLPSLRLDQPRRDAVDADVERRPFDGHR